MTNTKEFPTKDVLGAVTGILLAKIDGIYEVCQFAAGEPVFTHQLPRVGREIQAAMLKLRPELQQAVDESGRVTGENYQQWLATWVERYGETISVPILSVAQHERIDPISELAEKVNPSRIVVAEVKR